MITTYEEAVQFLYANLPMFQRVGSAAYKADLSNTIKLCEALGNPQEKFKSVHVTGTNGKGSTSHMLAAVLQSAGYKTGLYTSPHLKNFTERIRIDGKEVSQKFVLDFVNAIRPSIEEIKPSFFEITVAMAFSYFAEQKVDVAVIEVGLGGRLDSTNVITPEVSVITNIGWDHKEILGDTLEKIAFEKAGIIKHHVPVVISERQQNIEHVFIKKAKDESAEIIFATDYVDARQFNKHGEYYYEIWQKGKLILPTVEVGLQGQYQKKNIAGVFSALDVLKNKGFAIEEKSLRHGLKHVISLTDFKGRWQKLSDAPVMICDTAHNIDGVSEVLSQLHHLKAARVHFVWGMVKDKDVDVILKLLPKEAAYYFCQAKIPRALDAQLLFEKAAAIGLQGEVVPDVNDAIRRALVFANETDIIFIGGSTFVVAEIDGL